MMRGRPGCLLQSTGVEVNRILFASALSSMHAHSVPKQGTSYDTIRYDSVYFLTCSKKLTGSQLSLPHRTNKKLKCKTKNKMSLDLGVTPICFFRSLGKKSRSRSLGLTSVPLEIGKSSVETYV